jgi:hypothetical protein
VTTHPVADHKEVTPLMGVIDYLDVVLIIVANTTLRKACVSNLIHCRANLHNFFELYNSSDKKILDTEVLNVLMFKCFIYPHRHRPHHGHLGCAELQEEQLIPYYSG